MRSVVLAVLLGTALFASAQDEPSLGGHKLSEFPAVGAAPIFRLVSAGEEPRRALRYRLAAGSTHKLVMTIRMSLGLSIEGRVAPPAKMPATRIVFDSRVTEADDSGARFEFSMSGPPELFETEGVAEQMLEPMRRSLAQLSAIRGHVAMTNRGVVTEARLEVGAGLDSGAAQMLQSMQQSMEQTAVPLPADAVGSGAQWKMLQRVEGSGITVYQVAVFTLIRVEDRVATMAVTLEQFGPRQAMPMPEKAAGAKAELLGMQGRGEGHIAVDLDSPVPRSSLALDSSMAMAMQAEGKSLQMRMDNRMQVLVEPGTP